jgi:hypothetical protein
LLDCDAAGGFAGGALLPWSGVFQLSQDLIPVRHELRLRAEECLQEGAGQRCVKPVMFAVLDMLLLGRQELLAAQQMALGLFQMLKLTGPIHPASSL